MYKTFVVPNCLDNAVEATHAQNITSIAIKLIIPGSHGTITHLAPPLGLVLYINTKILENPLNKDTSI